MTPEDLILFIFNLIGGLVCHQSLERTLWVGGQYLPVCARDTGAYIGLLLGYLVLPLRKKDASGPPNLWLTALMVMPLTMDAGTQWLGLRTSTNELRLLTGLFFGTAIAPFLVYALSILPSSRKVPVVRSVLPKSTFLDSREHWLSNRAFSVSCLLALTSFVSISSITGSNNRLLYWPISSLIVTSIILHVIVLPIFTAIIFLHSLKSKTIALH